MAYEPTPETIDDQEARRRSVERLRQQANGHALPAKRLNGAHGHAPAAPPPEQINWAPIIAASEVRFERQLAELREQLKQLTDLVAKSGGLTDEELDGLARGMVPFLRERIADAVKPLSARLNELETVCRSLVEWRAHNG